MSDFNEGKDNVILEIERLLQKERNENYLNDIVVFLDESLEVGDIAEGAYYYYCGLAHYNLGKYEDALKHALESYGYEETYNTTALLAGSYYYLGMFEKALEFALKCRAVENNDDYIERIIADSNFVLLENMIFGCDKVNEEFIMEISTTIEELLESGHMAQGIANYFYGLVYHFYGDDETALEYTLKSYDSEKVLKNIELLTVCHYNLGNHDEALRFGLEYYELDPNNDGVNAKCAACYFQLGDKESAYEMIKMVNYKENIGHLFLYILISTESDVYVGKDERFKQELSSLIWDSREHFADNENVVYNVIKFSANVGDERLNTWAYNLCVRDEAWKSEPYFRLNIYYYRIGLFSKLEDFASLEKLYELIEVDELLLAEGDGELFETLAVTRLVMYYTYEHDDFKMLMGQYLEKGYSITEFLYDDKFDHRTSNKYLEYVYQIAVDNQDDVFAKHYGSDLLFGFSGITQDIEKAREVFKLSNEFYKNNSENVNGKESPCINRLLAELEAGVGNYDKAFELAMDSAVNSDDACNCGVGTVAQLIVDGKTSHDIGVAKELIRRSIDGYMLKENFEYVEMEHENAGSVNKLYAYFALNGEEGFSTYKALKILKEELQYFTNDIGMYYYISKLLKRHGSDHQEYYNRFLELLKPENESLNSKFEQDFYSDYTDLDKEAGLLIRYKTLCENN